jgi:hypothetical protein
MFTLEDIKEPETFENLIIYFKLLIKVAILKNESVVYHSKQGYFNKEIEQRIVDQLRNDGYSVTYNRLEFSIYIPKDIVEGAK